MTGSAPMTRVEQLLDLLEKHPEGITHRETRRLLNISTPHLSRLLSDMKKMGLIDSWRAGGGNTQGGVGWFSKPRPPAPPDPGATRHVTPTLPAVSSRAQEAYKVVRQLQHRDARHLAHAAGYSYGYAAEMMAELQQAGAL